MTHGEYTNSLRQVADFYDQHPEVPLPADMRLQFFGAHTPEKLAVIARAFGQAEKEHDKEHNLFYLRRQFGVIAVEAITSLSNVCRRVVTGTREIPEQIIPARSEEIIPAHTEEIVDWDCGSVLAGREEGE